jgi:hypothetical protein
MTGLLVGLFVATAAISITTNRDVFSPTKFYLVNFVVFFGAAFTGSASDEVCALSMLVLAMGTVAALMERGAPPVPAYRQGTLSLRDQPQATTWIWILTAGPILGQSFLIQRSGGFYSFVGGYGSRVLEWQGAGWATTLMMTVGTLNLCYLAVGLVRRRTIAWWSGFFAHLAITLFIVGLSGSRSAVLGTLVLHLITIHYMRRRVSIASASALGLVFVASALSLGSARERVGELLENGLSSVDIAALKSDSFAYGTAPLQLILDADPMPMAFGTTFLSALTNPVPRSWWPGKFDSGGIFLTKLYADDAWGGASNMTPTFLGEWVINFGWVVGIAGYITSASLLAWMLARGYRGLLRAIREPRSVDRALDVALYVCLMWSVVGLMVGEVTNVFLSFLLHRVAPIAAIRFACRVWLGGQPRS